MDSVKLMCNAFWNTVIFQTFYLETVAKCGFASKSAVDTDFEQAVEGGCVWFQAFVAQTLENSQPVEIICLAMAVIHENF